MSVQLLIDMNLPAEWVTVLTSHGWSAVHWSIVGDPSAEDAVIMAWALTNGYVVFTHDLDFGTLFAEVLKHGNKMEMKIKNTDKGVLAFTYIESENRLW